MSTTEAGVAMREVKGPSALAGGWRRFFDLLFLISVTEFRRTYFGTVLGYIWSLVRPLLLFAVLLFVFTRVVRIGSEKAPEYPVLLLLGIVTFTFFQEATGAAVTSVVSQEGVVRKTQFPRLVIPISVLLTSIFNLCLNLVVVFIFILAWGVDPTWTWLLFPPLITSLFVFTGAISMILAVLYVRFRDVGIIWGVVAQVLFYATPIIYPVEVIPERYAKIIFLNPLSTIFEQMRKWVLEPHAPSAASVVGGAIYLLPALAIFIGTCIFAVWIFNRDAPRIAEEL